MPTEENKVTRKLRAILSADVKGYSLLMSDDEAFTVKTLKEYRALMSKRIEYHTGRVVDAPGDNLLAEFASAVDAVECAVEIQQILKERNEDLPEDKRLEFRIGVNIGDVIQDGDSLYGEGVNIAARIEGLADAGGVCISRNAYDHIRNKLNLGYEYLGEHSVKNIKNPVRVYKLLMADEDAGKLIGDVPKRVTKKWVWATAVLALIVITSVVWQVYQKMAEPEFEPAKVEEMAYPLPEKPSIAVLPFVNMSGDPEQEYIGDSIAENIITALSYVPEMFIIARTSTFVYKGKSVKVKQISEELGVRYVLEGSVQKSKDRIRVTAQLIDAISGHHLWADRYDRNIEDFFKVLDEIAKEVVIELQVKLTEGDISRITHKTENFEAWLSAITAYSFVKITNKENIAKAKKLSKKAVRLDPEYGFAWGVLGAAHDVEGMLGWGESREKSFKLAVEYTDKAIKLDENLSCATSVKGRLYKTQGQFEQAIATGKKAIALGPSHDLPYAILSDTMRYAGQYEDSITMMEKAMRLNPYYPAWCLNTLGKNYSLLQRYEEAIDVFTRLLERAQKGEFPALITHLDLSANYIELGKNEEARFHAAQVIKIRPNISLDGLAKDISQYKNKADYARYIESFRKVGYPDKPQPPMSEKPSIAVLPFDNLSDDPEQEYFSDGMTDELIGDLAKIDGIFVISRNSTFTYKGKAVKIQQVAQELNVRYVLEGSVQRSGNKVRIRAQLIDGNTDHHIWSESYDGVMDDIFELQDEITGKIITALAVKLTEDEKAGVTIKGTENLKAYEEYLKGLTQFRRWTPDSFAMAIHHFERSIDIDPNYSDAYAMLGYTYTYATMFGGSKYQKAIGKDSFSARVFARHYLERGLEKPNFRAFSGLALMDLRMRRFESAKIFADKALLLAPNDADALRDIGQVLLMSGDPDAMQYFRKSAEADPLNPVSAGIAFLMAKNGQYEESLKWTEKSLLDNPYLLWCSAFSAISHAHLGNKTEAMAALERLYSILNSKNDIQIVQSVYNTWPFKKTDDFEWFIEGLRLAGVQFTGDQGYFKVEKEYRLSGEEIKNLYFGHTYEYDIAGWDRVKVHISKSGDADYLFIKRGYKDKGKARIEGDSLCYQFDNTYNGITFCSDVYKNPVSDKLHLREYLNVSDRWIFPIAITE